jgi:hypothetical protein
MVSSTLEIELGDLLASLKRIRQEHANDPEYKRLRANFPKSWPM